MLTLDLTNAPRWHALGVPPLVMAELLPVIEAVMVAKLNEQMDHSHGGKALSP